MTVGSAPSSSPTASLTRTPLRRSTATSWRIARPSADKFWTSHNPVIPNIKCHPCYSKTKVHWRPSMVFQNKSPLEAIHVIPKQKSTGGHPCYSKTKVHWRPSRVFYHVPWYRGMGAATKRRPVELLRDLSGHGTVVWVLPTPSCGTTPGFVRPWYCGMGVANAVLWNYSWICQAMVPDVLRAKSVAVVRPGSDQGCRAVVSSQ